VKPSDLRNDLWCRKTRVLGLSDGERISMIRSACLTQYTRVTDGQTDGRTDKRNWRGIYALQLYSVARKNSRPISWQTTKFAINFHRQEHGDWSELYYKIHIPYFLRVGNRGLVRVLEKKQHSVTYYRNLLHYGIPWDCGLDHDSV